MATANPIISITKFRLDCQLSFLPSNHHHNNNMATVVLVTGGTGLVGKAIEHIINTEPENSRFGKRPNETWVFADSAQGDLRWVPTTSSSTLD